MVNYVHKMAFALSISNVSNILSDRQFLLAVCIKPPNRRSTGADEGIDVLYFRKSALTVGYLLSKQSSVAEYLKHQLQKMLSLVAVIYQVKMVNGSLIL